MTSSEHEGRRRARFLEAAMIPALLALCAVLYSALWTHEFVNFDDNLLIYENEHLRSLAPLDIARLFELQILTPFYKPLVFLSWALQYHFFELDPRPYHLGNLLLHLANTLLVYALLRTLAATVFRRAMNGGAEARWGFLLATALFAVHPMRVESVAWASERKDVLFAFFFLSSLWTYIAWIRRRRARLLAASSLLFLLGTLCKAAIVTLPATLFVVDFLFRRRDLQRMILDKIPYALVLGGALALYGFFSSGAPPQTFPHRAPLLTAQGDAGEGESLAGDSPALDLLAAAPRAAGAGVDGSDRLARRLIAASYRIPAFTLRQLLPRKLAVVYPVPAFLAAQPTFTALAAWLALLMAFVALAVYALLRAPIVGAGAVFYLLTLAPALAAPVFGTNFLPDRYTYLPSIGLSVVAAATLVGIARRNRDWKPVIGYLSGVLVLALSLATFLQVGVWRNSAVLWQTAIDRWGEMPVALNNLGVAAMQQGDAKTARDHFDRAIARDPLRFRAYNNRALALQRLGELDAALVDLDRAIALQPGVATLHLNRGIIAVEAGQAAAGISDYSRAMTLRPELAESYLLRAVARHQLGDYGGAEDDLQRALELGGDEREALFHRGAARMQRGDFVGAVADNTAVLAIDPDDPRALNNRGFARFYLGELEAAVDDLNEAIRLDPSYPIAYRNRGDALSALGKLEAGCADWRTAERLGAPETDERLKDFCPAAGIPGYS